MVCQIPSWSKYLVSISVSCDTAFNLFRLRASSEQQADFFFLFSFHLLISLVPIMQCELTAVLKGTILRTQPIAPKYTPPVGGSLFFFFFWISGIIVLICEFRKLTDFRSNSCDCRKTPCLHTYDFSYHYAFPSETAAAHMKIKQYNSGSFDKNIT